MSNRTQILRTLAVAILLPLYAANAMACWVKSVSIEGDEMSDFLRVNFLVLPNQGLSINGPSGNFSVRQGVVLRFDADWKVIGNGDGLVVRNDERFVIFGGAHDSCVLHAIVESTRKGVELESRSQPNGFPARTERAFIEAR